MQTQTAIPKVSHIQKQRLEGEMIKNYVQENLILDELDYNTLVFNLGIEFLEQLGLVYYIQNAHRKSYWNWWKSEWHIWQQDLVKFTIEHDVDLDLGLYLQEMSVLAHDRQTESSFNNFLKIYKNGRM